MEQEEEWEYDPQEEAIKRRGRNAMRNFDEGKATKVQRNLSHWLDISSSQMMYPLTIKAKVGVERNNLNKTLKSSVNKEY